jgi:hypothetical protein
MGKTPPVRAGMKAKPPQHFYLRTFYFITLKQNLLQRGTENETNFDGVADRRHINFFRIFLSQI